MKDHCPKCNSLLAAIAITPNGNRFQKCSSSFWNALTHRNDGCDYVRWHNKVSLVGERCPKCGAQLVLVVTSKQRQIKKCFANKYDVITKTNAGCDYIEWSN